MNATNKDEIKAAIVAAGVFEDRIEFRDTLYSLPTPDWITNQLGAAFYDRLFNEGLEYQEQKWECNKFALLASCMAYESWAKSKLGPGTALAFGLFNYIRGLDVHEINVGIHRNASGLYVSFYEPQPSAPENFTALRLTCLNKRTLDLDARQSCLQCSFL